MKYIRPFLFSLLCLLSIDVKSLELNPMEVEFEPQGANSIKSFSLENKLDKDVAVDLSLVKRTQSLDGEDIRERTDDFMIYPKQVKLKSGENATVRVIWKGPSAIKKELSYRLIAEQLPVDFSKAKSSGKDGNNIDFMLRYVASIYVATSDYKPQINIGKIEKRKTQIHFKIKNSGTKHLVISGVKLSLNDKDLPYSADELKSILGKNILAESEIEVALPWPKENDDSKLDQVKINVE